MSSSSPQSSVRTGVLAATMAYTFWGFFPIYFFLMRGIPADEILAHRIIWAVPFGALIIALRSQWPEVRAGLSDRRVLLILCGSAIFIAINWLVYIAAVLSGFTMEASLGYYINPLMYVVIGVVLFGERLRRLQMISVGLATIGVTILTAFGGRFPVIAFTLAVSFTLYGVLRKRVNIGAMPGLFIETLLLAPIALGALIYFFATRDAGFETGGMGTRALLLLAGPLTVFPLLMFAIGARRLTLATLGFLQFIGPSLQFFLALADGEPFTLARQLCFGFIWTAAALFAWDAWKHRAPAS